MPEKKYKVTAPLGSVIVPKETMTEKELREYAPQLIMDPAAAETWREKAEKDPIDEVVEWLHRAGYEVKEC
jgi:hypothetical protein